MQKPEVTQGNEGEQLIRRTFAQFHVLTPNQSILSCHFKAAGNKGKREFSF